MPYRKKYYTKKNGEKVSYSYEVREYTILEKTDECQFAKKDQEALGIEANSDYLKFLIRQRMGVK